MQGQPRALADSHYPRWHHAPVTGLMNDPNGFIEFAGRYHLFYQWNPLACDHTFKCWAHWSSIDLLHWQHEPIALMPDEEYDRNGCYSGSAVDNNGTLTLCYTGNVKFAEGGPQNRSGPAAAGGLHRPRARPKSLATRRPVVHGAGRAGSAKARQGAAVQLCGSPSVDEYG